MATVVEIYSNLKPHFCQFIVMRIQKSGLAASISGLLGTY